MMNIKFEQKDIQVAKGGREELLMYRPPPKERED